MSEEILAKGIEAYQAGKLEPAIGGINAALRGRLPAAQMARAYYYRGLAYRKQGNPGRAISDFGIALDYPGLTDAERSDVQESREAAYREAGISEGERVVVATARETSVAPLAPGDGRAIVSNKHHRHDRCGECAAASREAGSNPNANDERLGRQRKNRGRSAFAIQPSKRSTAACFQAVDRQ